MMMRVMDDVIVIVIVIVMAIAMGIESALCKGGKAVTPHLLNLGSGAFDSIGTV